MGKSRNIFLFITALFLFISCNSIDESMIDSSDSIISQSTKNSLEQDFYPAKVSAKRPYFVSMEDATCFAKVHSRKRAFKINTYEIEGDTLLYFINYDSGWMILSGDKRICPIVAESDSGTISLNISNKNLLGWIDSFADEVKAIKSDESVTSNEHTKLWDKISKKKEESKTRSSTEYKWAVVRSISCNEIRDSITISHLVSTKWGQGDPWNLKLPIDTNNGNKRCSLGCVAVAFGQIVHYMHYLLGKPNGLYHNISVSSSSIAGGTNNIGFSRSNYNSNSSRWDLMPNRFYSSTVGTSYVGDLLIDIGNRVSMNYSAAGSGANLSQSAASYYSLTYSNSSYNFLSVKNDLLNSKPVNITAECDTDQGREGHSWIIDGISLRIYHYIEAFHFEYTDNWMHEYEYFDTFDQLRDRYHINSEYDYIIEDLGENTVEFLLMNWGYDGAYDNALFGQYPSDNWVSTYNYKYNKQINYDFR